ncbi:MAG: KpsF/GutQ family sugar-phosphate isomerase [Candidatus Pelagibacter sp.]|nr:KpsF/GutQ family sugar-phosphate isomerase [Candidatus Pelagibacter sp.]|tara:strand:- start:30 stop:1004 length:975 start_codon:yes stop_codon:yes gene_type:complete
MKSEKQILNFAKKIINEEIIALSKINKHLNKNFSKAVNLINNSKGNIVFSGVGKSKLILEKTCGTFSSLGISSYILDPNQASHGSLGNLQKNDTLIIASNSGNTNELLSIFKFAKKYKIKIIGISSNSKSQLFKNSDVNIIYSKVKEAGDKNFKLVPTSSTIALAAIGDALAISVAKLRNFKIREFGETHPSGSIGKSLTPIKELLITGKKIPYINSNASFSEVLSAIASNRLGCVLIKDKNSKKLSIITDGDTARASTKNLYFSKFKARDFMTKNPKYIDEMTLAPDALSIMNDKRITILLVKSKGVFKGLVSIHSIIEFLEK